MLRSPAGLIPRNAPRYVISSDCTVMNSWFISELHERPRIKLLVQILDLPTGQVFHGSLHVTRTDHQRDRKPSLVVTSRLASGTEEARTLDRILWAGPRVISLIAEDPRLRLYHECVPVVILDLFWEATRIHASLRRPLTGAAALALPEDPPPFLQDHVCSGAMRLPKRPQPVMASA